MSLVRPHHKESKNLKENRFAKNVIKFVIGLMFFCEQREQANYVVGKLQHLSEAVRVIVSDACCKVLKHTDKTDECIRLSSISNAGNSKSNTQKSAGNQPPSSYDQWIEKRGSVYVLHAVA